MKKYSFNRPGWPAIAGAVLLAGCLLNDGRDKERTSTWTARGVQIEDSAGGSRKLSGFSLVDTNSIWAIWMVGGSSAPPSYIGLYRTSNGGEKWEETRSWHSNTTEGVDSSGNGFTNWDWYLVSHQAFSDAEGWILVRHTHDSSTWLPSGQALFNITVNYSFLVRRNDSLKEVRRLPEDVSPSAWFGLDPAHLWYAVGDSVLSRTTDGGMNWQTYPVSLPAQARVIFRDSVNGWILGAGGNIQATSDGGATWTQQHSGTNQTLHDIHFTSPQSGWAVGDGGVILKTTNNGESWQTSTSEISTALWAVHFSDDTSGLAVGDSGTILRTTDGGINWTMEPSGVPDDLHDVKVFSDTRAIAVGHATILEYGGK